MSFSYFILYTLEIVLPAKSSILVASKQSKCSLAEPDTHNIWNEEGL